MLSVADSWREHGDRKGGGWVAKFLTPIGEAETSTVTAGEQKRSVKDTI